MKLSKLGANAYVVHTDDVEVLFCFLRPVAVYLKTNGTFIRTTEKGTRTVEMYIRSFIGPNNAVLMRQEFFDNESWRDFA